MNRNRFRERYESEFGPFPLYEGGISSDWTAFIDSVSENRLDALFVAVRESWGKRMGKPHLAVFRGADSAGGSGALPDFTGLVPCELCNRGWLPVRCWLDNGQKRAMKGLPHEKPPFVTRAVPCLCEWGKRINEVLKTPYTMQERKAAHRWVIDMRDRAWDAGYSREMFEYYVERCAEGYKTFSEWAMKVRSTQPKQERQEKAEPQPVGAVLNGVSEFTGEKPVPWEED